MSAESGINYNSAIRTFMSCYFRQRTLDEEGENLVAELLKGLNKELLAKFKQNKKSNSDSNAYLQAAHTTVEQVFGEELQNHAISEAMKQLALVESGVMTLPEGLDSKDKVSAIEAGKKKMASGIKKLFKASEGDIKMAKDGEEFFNTKISHLLEHFATNAASNTDGREVTPLEMLRVVNENLTGLLLKAANSEGARCIVLHRDGFIKFRPKTKSAAGEKPTSKKSKTRSVSRSGPKTKPTPSKTTASKEKTKSTKDKKPKKGTKTKGESKDKEAAKRKREGKSTKSSTKKSKPRSVSPAEKKRKTTSSKTTASKKKSKSTKDKTSEKDLKRKREEKDEETEKKPKIVAELDFTRGINDACKIFTKLDVSVKRDAVMHISSILEDICIALATKSAELAEGQEELTTDHIQRATQDLFPELLAQHAIARGSRLCSHNPAE